MKSRDHTVAFALVVLLSLLVRNVSAVNEGELQFENIRETHTTQVEERYISPPLSPSIWVPPPSLARDPPALPPPPPPPQSPQRAQQKKKRTQKEQTIPCRHTNCACGQYGDTRRFFTRATGRNKHERSHKGHNCLADGKTCGRCTELTENNEWKASKKKQTLKCRHTGCTALFTSKDNRSHHENQSSLHKPDKCGLSCSACTKLKRNLERQKKKREKENSCSVPICQPPVSEEIRKSASELSAQLRKLADEIDSLSLSGINKPLELY